MDGLHPTGAPLVRQTRFPINPFILLGAFLGQREENNTAFGAPGPAAGLLQFIPTRASRASWPEGLAYTVKRRQPSVHGSDWPRIKPLIFLA